MKLASFEAIASALDDAGVRYLVAGGLAVNAHGYLRFTNDADIVIQLVPDNVLRAFAALQAIGFRPSVPVTAAGPDRSPIRVGRHADPHEIGRWPAAGSSGRREPADHRERR